MPPVDENTPYRPMMLGTGARPGGGYGSGATSDDEGYSPISDTLKSVGVGVANTAQGVVGLSSLFGADMNDGLAGGLYQGLGSISDTLRDSQSATTQQARENVMGAWDSDASFGENVGSTLGAVAQNPAFLPNILGEAAGSIGPVGKAASALGKVGAVSRALPTAAGRAAAVEGGVIAGNVAGQIAKDNPDDYSARLLGIPAGVAGAALGLGGARVAGKFDPESFMARYFSNKAAAKAGSTAVRETAEWSGGRTGATLRGLAGEGLEEGSQEAIETAAINAGTPNTPNESVGQAFTIGAIMGAAAGGSLGLAKGGRQTPGDTRAPGSDRKDMSDTARVAANEDDGDAPGTGWSVDGEIEATSGNQGRANREARRNSVPKADQQAYETVARFMAEQVAAGGEGVNADPELARIATERAMADLGSIPRGRAGLRKFMARMGAKQNSWHDTFEKLSAMTYSGDSDVRNSARRILSIATGLPAKQLPNLNSKWTSKLLDKAVDKVEAQVNTLNRRIEIVGDGDVTRRARWDAERKDLSMQLAALKSARKVTNDALREKARADAEARAAREMETQELVDQGVIDDQGGQLDMLAEAGGQAAGVAREPFAARLTDPALDIPAATNPNNDAQLDIEPEILANQLTEQTRRATAEAEQERLIREGVVEDPQGQMSLLQEPGGEPPPSSAIPEAQPEGPVARQLGIEGEMPAGDPADASVSLLRRSVGARRVLAEAFSERAVDNLGNQSFEQLLALEEAMNTGTATLEQLARLAKLPLNKVRALTKRSLDAPTVGSSTESATDRVRAALAVAVEEQLEPYMDQYARMRVIQRENPDLSLAKVLAKARGPIRKVGDTPAKIRDQMVRIRQSALKQMRDAEADAAAAEADMAEQSVRDEVLRRRESSRRPPPKKPEGSDGQPSSADPRARLTDQPLSSLDGDAVADTIEEVVGTWENVPGIVVVENLDSKDVPQAVRDALADDGTGQSPAGVFYRGEVFLVREQLSTTTDVATTLYHEVVGHFGLRSVFGNQLLPILDDLAARRTKDVTEFAVRYGLDMSKKNDRRMAAEEFLAARAEALQSEGMLDRVLNMIRAFWADLTGKTLTDAQIIRDYIKPAQGFVMAGKVNGDLSLSDDVRSRLVGPANQPTESIMANEPELSAINRINGTTTNLGVRMHNALGFTTTMLRDMAKMVPSTRMLIEAFTEAQHLANSWQQKNNTLGESLHHLTQAQRDGLTDALVHYSSSEDSKVPYALEKSVEFFIANPNDPPSEWEFETRPVNPKELNISSWRMDQLDADQKTAMRMTFETTAEVLAARTNMKLENAKQLFLILEEQTADPGALFADYAKSVQAIMAQHNINAKGAYVPQSRVGEFAVIAKSPYFREVEMKALEFEGGRGGVYTKELRQLEKDHQHFKSSRYKTRAEAMAAAKQYEEDPAWGYGDWKPDIARTAQSTLDAEQLQALLVSFEAEVKRGADNAGRAAKLSDALRAQMRQVLADMGSQSTEVTTGLRKENIGGVVRSQVLDNTLEHVRHFGYALASAQSAPKRLTALQRMREEIGRFTKVDRDRVGSQYNELVRRLDNPFDDGQGFAEETARTAMGVQSLWYLLSNPSYYILQLTQSWVMTAPYMSGEFGTSAYSELAKAFAALKPVVQTKLGRGRQEITFEEFPDDVREMFTTLQERNVLDVGMSHDFGSLGENSSFLMGIASSKTQWGMAKLYHAARSVELINRMSASLAAYNLRVEKLTRGRPLKSFETEKQAEIKRKAIDYAEVVTYKTHGDYSYGNASMPFRSPVLRNILQFKKIAIVTAELLYSSASEGWKKPRMSDAAYQLFTDKENSIKLPADLLAKMKAPVNTREISGWLSGENWLTDNELALVREHLAKYMERSAELEMAPQQIDLLQQIYNSELHPDTYVTFEKALYQRKAFLYTVGSSAALSGSLSVPFLTTALAMMAKAGDDDDEAKALDVTPEATLVRVLGHDMASITTRGVIGGVLGIDVSRRIGINFVEQLLGSIYNVRSREPQDMVSEIVVGSLGPSVSMAQDMAKGVGYLSDYQTTGSHHDLAKGIASLSPLGIRNLIIGSLMDREGLVNDSRLTMIPREKFEDMELSLKKIGFTPTRTSEFYDLRTHKDKIEMASGNKATLLKRAYWEASQTNDVRRQADVMDQWKELQQNQRDAGLRPSAYSELYRFVRRKRVEARKSVGGMSTTSRNRDLTTELAEMYGIDVWGPTQ